MKKQNELEKVKNDFNEIVKTIDASFGKDYASKNPGLVQHLIDKVQQEEDRSMTRTMHNIN